MSKKYCTYIRVSTQKQGRSGLGLESQQKMCLDFIAANNGAHIAEFKDVESGTHRDRKGLSDAIAYCKKNGCSLVIAKLDRLARDVEFCFRVINTGIEIHFCDMPQINTLLLGVFASVAQYERELTSDRTKKALAAKKKRGEALGGASDAWKQSFNKKTKEERKESDMKRGAMKNERYMQKREVQVFLKVLKNVFQEACEGDDPCSWEWGAISTRREYKDKILALMKDYKELDESGALFRKWDFSGAVCDRKMHMKLCSHIETIREAVKTYGKNRNNN